ncbi:DUF6498-containing protein [Singulisphaera acidiphila]|uniref:Uncharacterized protein n=1 Tax=Singulisphaera acidiphila (strain ATCC BAA-1392 / DSM 18658 / VKM B-2454 / MOB10) TaxID=886293 RepID=L0D980_SINAD|nr:DUF6498-containing protein [Singulisphaera acidiphila]AGA25415.1 hypothetical protein Sinac_1016 [Singulisphaera acidiphila DSM 18658]
MITLLQMALTVVLNAIPAGGVIFRGWTPATALTLYWCENLVAAILIAVRIAIHRRLTKKRGHYRFESNANAKGRPSQGRFQVSYLGEFLATSLTFTLVHGLFLFALFAVVVKTNSDTTQVFQGLRWMVAAQLVSFVLDLLQLSHWSFADLKKCADQALGRVVLIHLAIVGGMVIAAFSSRPEAFFAVFGCLKTLSDLTSRIPYNPKLGLEPPRWFLWFTNRFGEGKHWKTGQDAATWWHETTQAQRQRVEEDEEVFDHCGIS